MAQNSENALLRQQIRMEVRQLRCLLSSEEQLTGSLKVAQRLAGHPKIQAARAVAVFLSFDNELNTQPIIEQFWQQQKRVYLPTLHPFSRGGLLFLSYTATTPLIINRLKIREPQLDMQQVLPLVQLDVILTPLVAFDNNGHRLGRGGGFYDRTLQNWQQHGPYPIGLAYDCQQVERCPVEPWDIPLAEVITPSKVWKWVE